MQDGGSDAVRQGQRFQPYSYTKHASNCCFFMFARVALISTSCNPLGDYAEAHKTAWFTEEVRNDS